MRSTVAIVGPALALSLLATSPSTQDLVLSEIHFSEQWIEIANLNGSVTADLTGWSLYQATKTAGKPGNYWFGFPEDTKIKPGRFLRVHWLANNDNGSDETDLYTGDTVFHFLFGLFAEALEADKGALALMSTQLNNEVNDSTKIMDWVSWGTDGFKRQDKAILNERWTEGAIAAAATGSPVRSLTYAYTNLGGRHGNYDWFLDFSPTPGADNLEGAKAERIGSPCTSGSIPPAALIANGAPAQGNKFFFFGIDRPLGQGEVGLNMLTFSRLETPIPVFGCDFWLNPSSLLGPFVAIPDGQGFVRLSFDPAILPPDLLFYSQWAVLDVNTITIVLTNATELVIGG